MKRFFSFVLVICTLLTVYPIVAPVAAESLPKDESGAGTVGTASAAEERGLSAYDALYVGADGDKTANGGRLLGLYSAFGKDVTGYDLTAGTWFNKMDASGATDAILRNTSDTVSWGVGENGGLAYRMDAINWKAETNKLGVTLPDAWADAADFTVEQVSRLDAIENGGNSLLDCHSAVRLDLLLGLWFPSNAANEHEWYCYRWTTGVTQDWVARAEDIANYEKHLREAYEANNGREMPVYSRYTKKTGVSAVSYGVAYATASYEKEACSLADYVTLKAGMSSNAMPVFSLFNGTPGEFYAIRVYDVALTEAEIQQNMFADMAAHFALDISAYLTLDTAGKAAARAFVAEQYTLSSAGELVQEALDRFCTGGKGDAGELLYVTDGLTYLLTSYKGHSTGYFDNNGTLLWKNGYGLSPAATLKGVGWQLNPDGGATFHQRAGDFDFNKMDFGIVLPSVALPEEDYTVEWVFNPIGLTVEKEDGTLERYVDNVNATGSYIQMSIAIGPLRALQFVSYLAAEGSSGQMERRWYYNATGNIRDLGWKYSTWDRTWADIPMDAVKTLAVTHNYDNGASVYDMYSDLAWADDMIITSDKYKTTAEASNTFHLMMGMPGTAYAVRVYDRVLTESEQAQNHMADLVYYYDLDASVMTAFMKAAGAVEGMFDGFTEIGFDLTREEAQAAFDNGVTKALISYRGAGVRKDASGLRYYFSFGGDVASALTNKGNDLELGVILNVDKNTAPLLEGYGYDYKIVAYDSAQGKRTGFFVENELFALTLLYEDIDKTTALTNILVRGYVRLTDTSGQTLTMYLDVEGDGYDPTCMFNVCYAMQDSAALEKENGTKDNIRGVVTDCYEKRFVHLQAGAAAGGDGTIGAPYRGFAEALVACKDILRRAATPLSVTLLMGDGEYGVYETATIADSDMPYLYSELHIASENGKSTLTTTKNIDSAFTKHADNIWVCQLDKETDGTYPAFRTLYVDGKMADVSYSSARHSYDGAPYVTRYSYNVEGTIERAVQMSKKGTLSEYSVGGYEGRPDLEEKFQLHLPTVLGWGHARDLFLVNKLKADTVITEEDTTYATNEAKRAEYVASFETWRDAFLTTNVNYESWIVIESEEAFHAGKQYLDIRLVECFRDEMETVKAALAAKAAAGDAEAKASLGDESWRRTALRYLNIEMNLSGQWWYYIVHLSGVDFDDTLTYEDGTVHVACYRDVRDGYESNAEANSPYSEPQGSMAGRYVSLANAYDYLNVEGEYYYDEATGKLYYYSENSVTDRSFARGTSDYMLILDNVRNVYFEDMRFTGMDDYYLSEKGAAMGLYGVQDFDINPRPSYATSSTSRYVADRSVALILDSQKLVFESCTFEELPAKAIHGVGGLDGITVELCTFENIGSSGIYFGAHDYNYDPEHNCVNDARILNNYFNGIGRVYYNAAAVHMGQNMNCKVMYNTVEDCSYTALSLGALYSPRDWMIGDEYNSYGLEVAYNYITDYMKDLGDGAAIYLSGYNAQASYTEIFNFVHDNYIVMSNETGSALGYFVAGIYFDAAASNWHCYNNVIAEQSYGAAEGEDEGFDMSDPAVEKYVRELRLRRSASTYIYLQLVVVGQTTYNILCENNYVINVRATDPKKQREEVYKTYLGEERRVTEKNTTYIAQPDVMPADAELIIYDAGSYGHTGDPYLLYDNNY